MILSTKTMQFPVGESVVHPRETLRAEAPTLCLKSSAERLPKAKSEGGLDKALPVLWRLLCMAKCGHP